MNNIDHRISFVNRKVEFDGNVWRVSGKWNGKTMNVYALHGDITKVEELREALLALAAELDYKCMDTGKKPAPLHYV